jgi:hypothetical protein
MDSSTLRRFLVKIGSKRVMIFKMNNRRGFAAICGHCLTEGRSKQQAYDRMVKAVRRVNRKRK